MKNGPGMSDTGLQGRLAEVAADTEGSMMSERRHREFLYSYSRYLEEYGPCGD